MFRLLLKASIRAPLRKAINVFDGDQMMSSMDHGTSSAKSIVWMEAIQTTDGQVDMLR
ncbi:hypothetical protein NXC14_PA00179 (plasmid) [Rhizobium sp. NXC14]|nr:hypothetical protein NXC14_PA00179 [Rhizobium sp. NXC14]